MPLNEIAVFIRDAGIPATLVYIIIRTMIEDLKNPSTPDYDRSVEKEIAEIRADISEVKEKVKDLYERTRKDV